MEWVRSTGGEMRKLKIAPHLDDLGPALISALMPGRRKEVSEATEDIEQIKEDWLVGNAVVAFVGALLMAQGVGTFGRRECHTHPQLDGSNVSPGCNPRHSGSSRNLVVRSCSGLDSTSASVVGHSSSISLLPDSPPNIVGVAFVDYARVEYRFGGSIWSDRAVGRTLAEDFEGMGSVAAPIMAVLRPKKAWPSLGDLAESPSTDAQTGPLMVGTARRTAPISSDVP